MNKSALFAARLLTPIVVWAGAFAAGWLGARIGESLTWLVVGGIAGGLAVLVGWTLLLSHLRKRSGNVTADSAVEDS